MNEVIALVGGPYKLVVILVEALQPVFTDALPRLLEPFVDDTVGAAEQSIIQSLDASASQVPQLSTVDVPP